MIAPADRTPLLGTVLSLADPALGELAASPLDFVWIDLEHGALDVRDVQSLAIAVQGAGTTAYVRLPSARSERIAAVLDVGVDGIVAPQVERAEDAAALVACLEYPPRGIRGFGPRRAGGYGRVPAFWTEERSRPDCVVQIETPAGVEAAADIAAVAGVDGMVVGCADLAMCLGIPGELGGPVQEAVNRVRAAAATHEMPFGVAAGGDPTRVAELAGTGATWLLYSADVRMYAAGVDAAMRQLRDALGTPTTTWERSHVLN